VFGEESLYMPALLSVVVSLTGLLAGEVWRWCRRVKCHEN
jgi:hypothetical protein